MPKKIGFVGGKFLPFHKGHEYIIRESLKQVDKLYIILFSSILRDTELCKRDGCKYIPPLLRLSWIGYVFRNNKNDGGNSHEKK